MSLLSILSQRPSGKLFANLLVSGAFIVLLNGIAAAQTTSATDGSTPLGLSPGAPSGSYSLSGFGTVNLYNGNLNFHLPLVRISGRGKADTASLLELNTKWTVNHRPIGTDGDVLDTPSANWWTRNAGYGPGLLVGRQSGFGSYGCGFNGHKYIQTLTRLTFTAGDGTEYEFRDQASNGQPTTLSNPCTAAAPSRGTVFITSDGSAATFISDTTIYDKLGIGGLSLIYPSGYLMLRDGTRLRIDSGNVTWLRDQNGNKIIFTYDSSNRVLTITDSLNRQVTFSYADYSSTFSDQITLKGFGGATRTISLNYSNLANALRTTNPRNEPASRYQIQTYNGLFPLLNNASSTTNFNPLVVSSVTLPNNQQYQFFYNSYGELARVNLPTGGAVEYDYTADSGGDSDKIYRRVIERRVYPDGANLEGYTTFSDLISGAVTVDQLTANGSLLSRTKHYFYGDPVNSLIAATGISYPAKLDGREYKTETYAADGLTLLQSEQMTWANRAPVSWWSWPSPGDPSEPPNDPRVSDTTFTLADVSPNLVSKHVFGYDDSLPYNNQNDVKEYDFGNGAPGALVRETQTTYLTSSTYTDASSGAHIRSLPSQVSIYDAGGIERARTTYEYDNYGTDANHAALVDRASISGLDSSFSTSYTTRGNATASTHYLLNGSGSIIGSVSGSAQYDIAGNTVKTIDARGNATTINFSDRFGAPDSEATSNSSPTELSSVGQASYAFATLITNAANQTTYLQFDYYLGRPVNAQDANGTVFTGFFNDALDRPTQIIRDFNNLSSKGQTTFSYDDANRTITTTSDQTSYGDNALKAQTLYDGLGRTTEARQYEGGTNYIDVQTQYDALGRAYKTSNPFRPWNSESAIWTTTSFDALSRVISVTTPDGAAVTTSYSGNSVTATDQAGKQRKSVSDALGRLTNIYEDPNGLNYQTSYTYDVLYDLMQVSQGSQTRTFVYDSLKRLTSATNPENGTASYTYDNNGNLLTRTDARGVVTTIAYDVLNRPTSKTYSDDTPNIAYFYDSQSLPAGAPTFNRGYSTGRLVAVTYGGGSAGNYAGFDALGRTLRKYQQTDSVNYLIEASYSVSFMTSETYPSVPGAGDRRTVTYTPDAAGRLASLNSNATTYAPAASVSSIGYASHNALNTETYGNSLIHAVSYNNRLQANEFKLGTSGAPTSALDLTYNYGTTNNNGNVQSLTYTGGGLLYTQSFDYDALNRLATATETSPAGRGTVVNWSQTNGYDQYGNRWIDYGGGVHNLAFSTSNNRITTAGFSYDANGNLTNDTIHAYTFDAENRIKTVAAVNAYTYDGGGQRVRKLVGENTRFVYGLGGQLIAEFDGSTGNLKKEYLYGGATLITIEPTAVNSNGTQYTTSDNLGSPRVITNASGSIVSRHDYLPFGEELCAGTGGRTTGMGFCAGGDSNRKKFTGYERDAETGLDFAQARYFSSTEGRFTSPDTLLGSLANPQSLNRYAYVGNNPLNATDPTGHLPVSATGPAPGSWGGFEGPEPGDLPERYEQEIANIKAVIAENRNSASGALGSEAALGGSNESAPEHGAEEGHSGGEATGGEHETQNPDDEVAANTVANGVEAALQVLKNGCWSEQQWNQDVQPGSRYFANVSNASAYTQNWSRSLSVHDTGVRESPALLTRSYVITTTNGRIDTSMTLVTNAVGAFNFVVKYYPGQGMAVTSNTASIPHVLSTPGYTVGRDPNVNVRWAQLFLKAAPQCQK